MKTRGPVSFKAASSIGVFLCVLFVLAFSTGPRLLATARGVQPGADGADWDERFSFPGVTAHNFYAAAVSGDNLYVGGLISGIAGLDYTVSQNVARWDGRRWHSLGVADRTVYGLATNGNDVYAVGDFTTISGVAARGVARWDGAKWNIVGNGLGPDGAVQAVAVSNGELYIGGRFNQVDGQAAVNLAKWNGSNWTAVGNGTDGYVYALTAAGSELYVGGQFTRAGGVTVNGIARWNGSSFAALGSGTRGCSTCSSPGTVYSIAVNGSEVYIGGEFPLLGDLPANSVARWNGSSWSALGTGALGSFGPGRVYRLSYVGNALYAIGDWQSIGGLAGRRVAKWNGAWSALPGEYPFYAGYGALVANGRGGLYFCGGNTIGELAPNAVAEWTGSEWRALGQGIHSGIFSATVHAVAVAPNGDVYAGGNFIHANGKVVNSIARWDGAEWHALGKGLPPAPNSSSPGTVAAIAIIGNSVYVGGNFKQAGETAANNIARWDTATNTWSALGNGVNAAVNVLAASGNTLYVGGAFTTAGPTDARQVARWDGANWSKLGAQAPNFDPSSGSYKVYALLADGNELYIGGDFKSLALNGANHTANGLVVWDSTSDQFSVFGSGATLGVTINGVARGYVTALARARDGIYIGGDFDQIAGVVANGLARLNGSGLSAVGDSLAAPTLRPIVAALTALGDDLYVGGIFHKAGAVTANGIVKWSTTANAWSALAQGVRRSDLNTPSTVAGLAARDGKVYVGGQFIVAGDKPSAAFAIWNTSGGNTGGDTIALTSGTAQTGTLPAPQGNAVFGSTQYTINVPPDAAQLKIDLNGNADVDLFARLGSRLVLTGNSLNAEYKSDSETGTESITITAASTPPLRAGTYYIGILNYGPSAANFTLTATATNAQASGIEADLTPRPNGNGAVSATDLVLLGRFVAGLEQLGPGSEFQRADCAPRDARGNGVLSATDLVQAGRYAAGLDPLVPAGGPTGPASIAEKEFGLRSSRSFALAGSIVRLGHASGAPGKTISLPIELVARGNEAGLSFSLTFAPTDLSFVQATLDAGVPAGATLTLNQLPAAKGRLGIVLALPAGQRFPAGIHRLLSITFKVAASDATEIAFSRQPVAREISDANGHALPASFIAGTLALRDRPKP